jgi:hypothetical protein
MYLIQFPQLSNRASWPFVGMLTDLNNVPIDLTGYSMVFAICAPCSTSGYPDGYGYGYGDYSISSSPLLVASTDNGNLTIYGVSNPGMFRWNFTLQQMSTLCRGTYPTGLTLTTPDGTQTVQLSVGPLPIIDGNVP